jgi:diguanylate cyclase (GGDEF)-like protein
MAMPTQKEMHQLELMQTIFGIISKRDLSIDQQLEEILKAGCSLFGEQIGIVSRIEGDTYIVEHAYAPGFDIHKGQEFELKKTFCSIMIGSDKPLSIEDVKSSAYRKHPCTKRGVESYIGMSITVEGEKFGTLNFSSTSPKDQPFLDADLDFMTTLCDWIGNVLGYSRMLDKLNTLASQDSLTQLSNRSIILELIERCLMRHSLERSYIFAILFVDLDRFKQVNDNLGHHIGDLLLNQVAQRLQSIMRPSDRLGRYGGDEFIVILDGAEEQRASKVATRITDALTAGFIVKEHEIDISASVGIAVSDGVGSALELIDKADRSMYQQKNSKL